MIRMLYNWYHEALCLVLEPVKFNCSASGQHVSFEVKTSSESRRSTASVFIEKCKPGACGRCDVIT